MIMAIFVDTADLDQIRESYSWGIVNGVTTNPSLIKKAVDKLRSAGSKSTISAYIEEILRTAEGDPVSLEVIGTDEESMFRQGMFLYERFNEVADNVVVKIPVCTDMGADSGTTFDGLKAIKRLAEAGVPINVTLIFTPEQALLAAKAGAAFVSPFAGRIDDDLRQGAGETFDKMGYYPEQGVPGRDDAGIVSGVDLVARCVDIMEVHGFEGCKVLAASLRNPRQVRECALAGAHVATMPFDVLRGMISHKKTVEGMKLFTADVVPDYAKLFD
jgi:transaldolase